MSALRERNRVHIIRELKPVAHLLKSWYLNVGYDFINSQNLTSAEEDILERVSDYYLEQIKNLEQTSIQCYYISTIKETELEIKKWLKAFLTALLLFWLAIITSYTCFCLGTTCAVGIFVVLSTITIWIKEELDD